MADQPMLPDVLAAFLDTVDHAYICVNPAIETMTVLDAARPWKDKLTLIYVHSDHQLPEVISNCRRLAQTFGFIELQAGDPFEQWADHGMASKVVTAGSEGILQPMASCCAAVRQRPVIEFLRQQEGRIGFISAQRYAGHLGDVPARGRLPERIALCTPLWSVSDEQFAALVAERDIEIPFVVSMAPDGLDCGGCAARMTPARMAYVHKYYPDLADDVSITAEVTLDAVKGEFERLIRLRDGAKNLRRTATEANEEGLGNG